MIRNIKQKIKNYIYFLKTFDREKGFDPISITLGVIALGVIAYNIYTNSLYRATLGNLAVTLLTLVVGGMLAITTAFLTLSANLLSIVTNPNFISFSYTNPAGNKVIEMGLQVTTSLANMGIVIALLIVGISTILRIENYQAKKVLPKLIIIALLINFAPVILGIVVDFSNILMNFFLKDNNGQVISNSFIDGFQKIGDEVKLAWKNVVSSSPNIDWSPMGRTVMLLFFTIITFIVFLIFSLLFFIRYIVIWILTILAPLAFVAYILPSSKFIKTQEIFEKWANAFIQWCFIGVTSAFFIYLAAGLVAVKDDLIGVKARGSTGEDDSYMGLLNTIMPYAAVCGLLYMGFAASLSVSALGAQAAIGYAKKYGTKTLGYGWKGTKWATGATAGKVLTSKRIQGYMQGLAKIPTIDEGIKATGATKRTTWAKRIGYTAANLTGFGTVLRLAGISGLKYGSSQTSAVESSKKKLEESFGKNEDSTAASYNHPLNTWKDKLAIALRLAELGGAKAFGKLTKQQQDEVVGYAISYSPSSLKSLVKINPLMLKNHPQKEKIKTSLVYINPETKENLSDEKSIEKALSEIKPKDIEKMDKETISDPDIMGSLIKTINIEHIREITRNFDSETIKKLEEGLEKLKDTLEKDNPRLYNSLRNTSGGSIINIPSSCKKTEEDKGESKKPSQPTTPLPGPGSIDVGTFEPQPPPSSPPPAPPPPANPPTPSSSPPKKPPRGWINLKRKNRTP